MCGGTSEAWGSASLWLTALDPLPAALTESGGSAATRDHDDGHGILLSGCSSRLGLLELVEKPVVHLPQLRLEVRPAPGSRQSRLRTGPAVAPPCHVLLVHDVERRAQLIPESHDHHRLRYIPLVHPNVDQHPEPEDVGKQLRATLDAVHQQDMAGGRYCWAGAQSRLARPGRRSPLETQLWQMHNWLLDQLEKR